MKIKLTALLLSLTLLLSGCHIQGKPQRSETETAGEVADLGDDNKTFGEDIEEAGAYNGYFEGNSQEVEINCISGTKNAYRLEGSTLSFTSITEDSVYTISGTFNGNIVIDTGDDHKFDLELHGFSLVCDSTNPILVKSGDEVTIKAKKDTENYIYDMREAIDASDETLLSGAIHSEVDLEIMVSKQETSAAEL